MAKNSTPSQLDPGQILKRVFDDSNDAIRTDTTVVANIAGAIEVQIEDTDDSIKIGDGSGHYAAVSVAGAIKVDNSAVTQPISGAVTVSSGSVTVSNASGASAVNIQDGGNSITVDGTVAVTNSNLDVALSTLATHVDTGTTIPGKLDTLHTDIGTTLHTDLNTTISGKLDTLHTDLATTLHTDITSAQSRKLQDGSGNVITSTASALDINLKSSTVAIATSGKQDTGNSSLSSIDGKITACNTGSVVITSGTVNVGNSSGGSAVNIQDGGNSITVDGAVTVSGTATTTENRPSTTSVTAVASSSSNVTLLALNASRRHAMFFNDSTAILYIKLGTTATTTTSYTLQVPPKAFFELPVPVYSGNIDGIWASANGNCLVTEIT